MVISLGAVFSATLHFFYFPVVDGVAFEVEVEAYFHDWQTAATNALWRVVVIRVLCGRFFGGGVVSVGYAIAHPRLNPVGIMPPGSRPSDVHSADGIIMVVVVGGCDNMRSM